MRITDVKASARRVESLGTCDDEESLIFEDGCLTAPQRPGLGLELHDAAFKCACEA